MCVRACVRARMCQSACVFVACVRAYLSVCVRLSLCICLRVILKFRIEVSVGVRVHGLDGAVLSRIRCPIDRGMCACVHAISLCVRVSLCICLCAIFKV